MGEHYSFVKTVCREKSTFILNVYLVCMFCYSKENPACVSWIDSTLWNSCNISMHIIIIKRKERKNRRKNIFSLQLLVTCATLQNILKINKCILTNYQHKLNASRRNWGFKTLKHLKSFNTLNHNVCKSHEFPQINHLHSSVSHLLKKWGSYFPQSAAISKLIWHCCTLGCKANVCCLWFTVTSVYRK